LGSLFAQAAKDSTETEATNANADPMISVHRQSSSVFGSEEDDVA
jgi:hypothetical protein